VFNYFWVGKSFAIYANNHYDVTICGEEIHFFFFLWLKREPGGPFGHLKIKTTCPFVNGNCIISVFESVELDYGEIKSK
jgi:hypothetical protein